MRFGLLLLPEIPSSIVAGLIEFFQVAALSPLGKDLKLETVSMRPGALRLNGGLSIEADVVGPAKTSFDLFLIPAIGMNTSRIQERFGLELAYVKELARRETRIASICSGAFLLAETGLLSGRAATTHWRLAERFRRRFADVDLQIERMVVDSGPVLTSGGSNAFYDLALYVLEQHVGYESAQFVANHLLVDSRRAAQSPFMPVLSQKVHSDSLAKEAQFYLEQRFREEISPDTLAHHVGVSVRSLFRRFKAATGSSPVTYQQRLRVEAARRRLSESDDTVEEISLSVGYESVSFFRQVFKKHTGFNPLEYRRRFQRP